MQEMGKHEDGTPCVQRRKRGHMWWCTCSVTFWYCELKVAGCWNAVPNIRCYTVRCSMTVIWTEWYMPFLD